MEEKDAGKSADFADFSQIVNQLTRAAAVEAHPVRVADRFGRGPIAGKGLQILGRAVLERKAAGDRLAGPNGRGKDR